MFWSATTRELVETPASSRKPFQRPPGLHSVVKQWETVIVSETLTGKLVREFSFLPREAKRGVSFVPFLAHAIISTDGSVVAASGYFNHHLELPEEMLGPVVQLWSVKTGKRQGIYVEQEKYTKTPMICFSPDGMIVAVGVGEMVRLLSAADGDLIDTLRAHQGDIQSISFSPDSSLLVTAADDNSVVIWKVQPAGD